jgi:Cu-Zn family superoxide dismutase
MVSGVGLAVALIVVLLNCAALAEQQDPVYASASFDDMRSFIISADGLFLQGNIYVNQSLSTSNTISVILFPFGDIASSGSLSGGTTLYSFKPSSSCTVLPCMVSFSATAGDWCGVIGKGVSVSVDDIDTGIHAVFGIGQSGAGNCSFATSYNSQPAFAIVKVQPVASSAISGTVIFQLWDNALTVSGVISGLMANSLHGMHVHTFGDVRDFDAAANTGSHFSPKTPTEQIHGLFNNASRHTGDLGNILADKNGVAFFNILVPQDLAHDVALTLIAKRGSAIGRAIILHMLVDDGVSQPSGNSGNRIGQGVIGYADTVSSDAVLALMQAGGSAFGCGCTLTDENSGVTYNGFCQAKDCKQLSWTTLILVVTLGPLSVLLVLALMKFQTWRTTRISSKKVGVTVHKWGSSNLDQSMPLLAEKP